jgi:glucokinase
VNSSSAPVIAFDLGGTDLKAARVGESGELLAFARRPSRVRESATAPYEAMAEALEALGRDGAARAIGVGCPGVIDPVRGAMVDRTANLPHWLDEPLRERIEARFGLPAVVDNDANCAALAEHRLGAARGARVSLTVTLGTGVGCGIVVDGRPYRGAHGGAGEIGHLPLGLEAARCACGVDHCVEPEMSGSGLVRRARDIGLECEDAAAVFAFAARGELRAKDLVDHMADRLGAALATAINLFDPDVVVIGGGVSQAGDALFGPLGHAVSRYALASHRRGLRLVPAALGERAGVIGAGLLGMQLALSLAGGS